MSWMILKSVINDYKSVSLWYGAHKILKCLSSNKMPKGCSCFWALVSSIQLRFWVGTTEYWVVYLFNLFCKNVAKEKVIFELPFRMSKQDCGPGLRAILNFPWAIATGCVQVTQWHYWVIWVLFKRRRARAESEGI